MEGADGSVIGQTIVVRGRLVARDHPLRIGGRIEGVVDHDDLIRVEEGGSLEATLMCRELEVEGSVLGTVFATERASIAASGRVNGRVVAPVFSVAEGARLDGSVEMDGDGASAHDAFLAATGDIVDESPATGHRARAGERVEQPEAAIGPNAADDAAAGTEGQDGQAWSRGTGGSSEG